MLEVEPKEKSLSEVAYEHIKLKVLELVYFPGMYLNEESLAKELGMSRMPIRTAVQRLADEGWLIVCFRKQLRVSDITSKDILELYEIRELLEMMAINRIFAEGTNWEYSYALEGITVQMRANRYHPLQFEISDLEFHLKTIDIFNNKRIHKFTRAIRVELIRIGFLSQTSPEDNDLVVDQLMQLVLAIREKRLNDALEVLKDHLDSGRNLALDKLKLNKLARPDKEHIEKEPEPRSVTA